MKRKRPSTSRRGQNLLLSPPPRNLRPNPHDRLEIHLLEEQIENSEHALGILVKRLADLDLRGKVDRISNFQKGYGGYSDIFTGRMRDRNGKYVEVAVKKLRVHIMEDRKFKKRLAMELYIWSKLKHRYILPLEGFFIEGNSFPHLVSRWIENGHVLKYLIANPNTDLFSMIIKIAESIHFIHSKDVVHSDIKPDNILISDSGDPLLCDFGVSRVLTASQSLQFSSSLSSELRGTIAYMAKEILADQSTITYSKESDIWAFGMTVYALLTKKQPYYEKAAVIQVILAISQGILPTAPDDIIQGPLQNLWDICKHCWEPTEKRMSAESCIARLQCMIGVQNLVKFDCPGSRILYRKCMKAEYKDLPIPNVFTWRGLANVGTWGVDVLNVSYTAQLNMPQGCKLIELIASERSFQALDSLGRVYIWRTVYGEISENDRLSNVDKLFGMPLCLELPEQVRALSCGYYHTMALDAKNQIWTFDSWDSQARAFRIVTNVLDGASPSSTPVQAECGDAKDFVLTASGDIYVLSPSDCNLWQRHISTMMWALYRNPQRLPAIPHLPVLYEGRISGTDEEETKVVKIAVAMSDVVIALTNKGHVLRFRGLNNATGEMGDPQAQWEYLPNFSEKERILAHRFFEQNRMSLPLPWPRDTRIAHITANHDCFVAYTNEDCSIVLQGDINITVEEMAHISPDLQFKEIVSVSLGRDHNLAVSLDGKLYSWSRNADLRSGLSQIREVNLAWDLKRRRQQWCVAAAAGGQYPRVLVI